jgi:4-amino-4-deoxy-L-arabinose transferase-like glycosyltransferase
MPFVEEFFWRHHLERLFSESIQHMQPFWFFVPVLLAGLLPWTPLLALLLSREAGHDPRTRFLLGWALTTLVFFSLSTNKLPGYILPALPPLAALMGIRLAQARQGARVLVAVAPLLVLAPLAGAVLPVALSQGLSRAWPPADTALWPWIAAAAVVAGATLWLTVAGRLPWAMVLLGLSAIGGFVYLKHTTFQAIDREAGTRTLWGEIGPLTAETCVGDVRRHVRYGLDYYSVRRLPDCSVTERPYRIESDPPRVVRVGAAQTGRVQADPVQPGAVQANREDRP